MRNNPPHLVANDLEHTFRERLETSLRCSFMLGGVGEQPAQGQHRGRRREQCNQPVNRHACRNQQDAILLMPSYTRRATPIHRGWRILVWEGDAVLRSLLQGPRSARSDARKYAEGELGARESIYFHGPDGALNLRAQNLSTFLQLVEGVDDKTWLQHLRGGEYSAWFRQAIKDDDLAAEAHVGRARPIAVGAGQLRAHS